MSKLDNWRKNLTFILDQGPVGIKGDVAEAAGFHYVHLSNILADRRRPSFEIAIAISDVLDIPIADMLELPVHFRQQYANWELKNRTSRKASRGPVSQTRRR